MPSVSYAVIGHDGLVAFVPHTTHVFLLVVGELEPGGIGTRLEPSDSPHRVPHHHRGCGTEDDDEDLQGIGEVVHFLIVG